MSITLDKTKLKQLTNSSATASRVMILLGLRQRARSFTNLADTKARLLEMGEKIVDRDYMDFWRGLEECGAGSLVLGRRGGQTRFVWDYSLKDVAKYAIEGNDSKEFNIEKAEYAKISKKKTKKPAKREAVQMPSEAYKQEKLFYRIKVRPNYTVEIGLPSDATPEEIEKVRQSLVLPTL